jgi:hypothetical protein
LSYHQKNAKIDHFSFFVILNFINQFRDTNRRRRRTTKVEWRQVFLCGRPAERLFAVAHNPRRQIALGFGHSFMSDGKSDQVFIIKIDKKKYKKWRLTKSLNSSRSPGSIVLWVYTFTVLVSFKEKPNQLWTLLIDDK